MKKISLFLILQIICSIIVAENDPYEILKRTTHISISGNKMIRTDSVLLQVNERMGDDAGKINCVYSNGEKIDVLYARIENMIGFPVRELKNKEIITRSYLSDMAFYDDNYVKSFELKHNVYPYRISYAVKSTTSKFIQLLNLDPSWQNKKIHNGKVIIETPQYYTIKYKQEHLNNPVRKEENGIVQYVWNYNYDPIKIPRNANVEELSVPWLKVVPSEFTYGEKGSWKSWQSFGDWISRLNAGRDELTPAEKIKVDALLTGHNDTTEKVKTLYHYLQRNTRYINVRIDIGGLQTYPAGYVCDNKYGDCKALVNYMQALLKYAGIKSYYTLINADEVVEPIDPDFPFQEFNHVILTVPLEKDTVFLECTGKNMPFAYIHESIQGRQALLVNGVNSHLITIPGWQPEDVLSTRHIVVNQNSVRLESVLRGAAYEKYNYIVNNVNKNTINTYIGHTVFPEGAYHLINYDFKIADADIPAINFNAEISVENILKRYGDNFVFKPFPLFIPDYETPEKRNVGVRLDYPVQYIDTVKYYIPVQHELKVPENILIENDFGHYMVNFNMENDFFTVSKSVSLKKETYPLSDYPAFYEFIRFIKNNENKNIYISPL